MPGRVVAVVAALSTAACNNGGGGDPLTPAELDQVGAVLCEIQAAQGSVYVAGSAPVVLTDCP